MPKGLRETENRYTDKVNMTYVVMGFGTVEGAVEIGKGISWTVKGILSNLFLVSLGIILYCYNAVEAKDDN